MITFLIEKRLKDRSQEWKYYILKIREKRKEIVNIKKNVYKTNRYIKVKEQNVYERSKVHFNHSFVYDVYYI